MIKGLIMLFLIGSCIQNFSESKENAITKIVIKRVDFSIYTFVSVSCEDFENQFKSKYSTTTLTKEKEFQDFLSIFKNSIALGDSFKNYTIDTRTKVEIFFNDGNIKKICIGNPAYEKDGEFFENSDIIRESIEKLTSD